MFPLVCARYIQPDWKPKWTRFERKPEVHATSGRDFFDLPLEIRIMIYKELFGDEPVHFRYSEDETAERDPDEREDRITPPAYGLPKISRFRKLNSNHRINPYFSQVGPALPTQILSTCKQIYDEASPFVFKERVLKVAVDPWTLSDDGLRCWVDDNRSPWVKSFRLTKNLNAILSPSIKYVELFADSLIFEQQPRMAYPGMETNEILKQGNELVDGLPGIEKLTIEVAMRTRYKNGTWAADTCRDWSSPDYLFNHIREICRAEGMRIRPALYVTLNPGVWLPGEMSNDPDLFPEAWKRVKELRRI
jgi:hypothetical protein